MDPGTGESGLTAVADGILLRARARQETSSTGVKLPLWRADVGAQCWSFLQKRGDAWPGPVPDPASQV